MTVLHTCKCSDVLLLNPTDPKDVEPVVTTAKTFNCLPGLCCSKKKLHVQARLHDNVGALLVLCVHGIMS